MIKLFKRDGYLKESPPNIVIQKIEFYLKNEDKRRVMGEKGRELVLSKHTFDERVKIIVDSLRELKIE